MEWQWVVDWAQDPLVPLLLAAVLVVAVSALAPRIGVSTPLALVLVGTAISLLPFIPPIEVEPDFILAFVLPPLLYSAAAAMPTMDFRRDFNVISLFAFALVALTSVGIGFLFTWMIPGLSLAAGIAFGAIVSPTDAIAIKIARRVGLPSRLAAVLNGEVLLNDASSLVILKSAVAAIAGAYSFGGIIRNFLWSLFAAAVIGAIVGIVALLVRRRVGSAALSTAVSLIVPYIAFLPSEHIGASGLVAAVIAGLITGHFSVSYLTARERVFDRTIWTTVETVVEGAVFLLMGLEIYALLLDVHATYAQLGEAALLGFLTLFALLAIRGAFLVPVLASARRAAAKRAAYRHRLEWMEKRLADSHPFIPPAHEIRSQGTWGTVTRDTIYRKPARRRLFAALVKRRQRVIVLQKNHQHRTERPSTQPSAHPREYQRFLTRIRRAIADTDFYLDNPIGPREGLLLVFAGMRGAVTLAAAQSLPRTFPHRSFIVLIAFLVAFISLLLQGSLLPIVVRRLALASTAAAANEDSKRIHLDLEQVTAQFLDNPDLRRADGRPYDSDVIARVRAHLVHPDASFELGDHIAAGDYQASYRELWAAALNVQRNRLLEDRRIGIFDSEPLEAALSAIDAEEMMIHTKPAAWLADN